ncbi:hypothetical protein SNE510_60860 [Streptomyces sp. NE5-10]|nr:hypothetical protein SNE510_60860 [Streptomyces sp. NE5-10]
MIRALGGLSPHEPGPGPGRGGVGGVWAARRYCPLDDLRGARPGPHTPYRHGLEQTLPARYGRGGVGTGIRGSVPERAPARTRHGRVAVGSGGPFPRGGEAGGGTGPAVGRKPVRDIRARTGAERAARRCGAVLTRPVPLH